MLPSRIEESHGRISEREMIVVGHFTATEDAWAKIARADPSPQQAQA